jgi:hypothetical protein
MAQWLATHLRVAESFHGVQLAKVSLHWDLDSSGLQVVL